MKFRSVTIQAPASIVEQVEQMAAKHGQTLDSFTAMAWVASLIGPTEKKINNASKPTVDSEETGFDFSDLSIQQFDFGALQCQVTEDYIYSGHLWGQFHRYLPIKFTLRHLALLLQSANASRIPVSEWHDVVKESACKAWLSLRSMDLKFMKSRGEQLASGFPNPTIDNQERIKKGISRFARHFCVDGKDPLRPTGMPAELGFITLHKDAGQQLQVSLTQAGLEFVQLESPIFDTEHYGDALDKEEVKFLIQHTIAALPDDLNLMLDLLRWVDVEEITTATALDEKMYVCYGEASPWAYNTATCNTYKGGVMGRLSEMKLLNRRWENRRATYSVSAAGRELLKEMGMIQ